MHKGVNYLYNYFTEQNLALFSVCSVLIVHYYLQYKTGIISDLLRPLTLESDIFVKHAKTDRSRPQTWIHFFFHP